MNVLAWSIIIFDFLFCSFNKPSNCVEQSIKEVTSKILKRSWILDAMSMKICMWVINKIILLFGFTNYTFMLTESDPEINWEW